MIGWHLQVELGFYNSEFGCFFNLGFVFLYVALLLLLLLLLLLQN
jgi:hypothetical protein